MTRRLLKTFLWWMALLALVVVARSARAQEGTIAVDWDEVAHADLAGYQVFSGTAPTVYTRTDETPAATGWVIENLDDCTTYYIAVSAVDTDANVSASPSNEIEGWPRPRIDPVSVVPVPVAGSTDYLLELTGANFQTGAAVTFRDPEIVVQGITDQGCQSIAVTIRVTAGAPRGQLEFVVVNPDTVFGLGVLPVGFSIVPNVRRADGFEGFAE